MGCEGGRDDPLMMGFVDVFVEEGDVKPTVDPVNAVIREYKEARSNNKESLKRF